MGNSTGAFVRRTATTSYLVYDNDAGSGHNGTGKVEFFASSSNNMYGKYTTVKPESLAVSWYIRF